MRKYALCCAFLIGVLPLSGCVQMPSLSDVLPGTDGTCSVTGTSERIDEVQNQNAQAVVTAANELGLTDVDAKKAATIGVTTIGAEATYGKGYPYGQFNIGDKHADGSDTSSRGIFQQKEAWGPLEDRLDPKKSAHLFFTGGADGQKGLLDISGWSSMPIPQAAQSVQGSPSKDGGIYAKQLDLATAITNSIIGNGVVCSKADQNGIVVPAGLVQNSSQDPTDYGWALDGPKEDLKYKGKSFGKVAAGTAPLWVAFLTELEPTVPGGFNSEVGCYDRRQNVNSPGQWSLHAYGLACDINSGKNCNGCPAQSIQGDQYAMPMSSSALATKYGLIWGGDFNGTPDPMHYELHITPQQVASITKNPAPAQ